MKLFSFSFIITENFYVIEKEKNISKMDKKIMFFFFFRFYLMSKRSFYGTLNIGGPLEVVLKRQFLLMLYQRILVGKHCNSCSQNFIRGTSLHANLGHHYI